MSSASLCLAACLLLTITSPAAGGRPDVPAFPGAEGAGAEARGGRGGRVIQVTNLNDSGPGSLRAAIEDQGPRTVVFRVAGTIRLESPINLIHPYLTVAGQTAPGGGIRIRGSIVAIQTHDVVIRFLKYRTGPVGSPYEAKTFFIKNGSHHIIIDHCSLSWARDEILTCYATNGPIHHVTLSWNIIAEGLHGTGKDSHAAGAVFGSVKSADLVGDLSIHHNYFAHNQFRMPYVKGRNAEVINNVTYDWMYWSSWYRGGITVDLIGNRYRMGPAFLHAGWTQDHGILWCSTPGDNGDLGMPGKPSIFIEGNRDDLHHPDPAADNWPMIEAITTLFKSQGNVPLEYRRRKRQQFSRFPVTVHPVKLAGRLIFRHAGASHRLDGRGNWLINRDGTDRRLIQQFRDGTGRIIKHPDEVGGWTEIPDATPYPDQDADGISDAWEIARQLDPDDPADACQDPDDDGFTHLENFLNPRP